MRASVLACVSVIERLGQGLLSSAFETLGHGVGASGEGGEIHRYSCRGLGRRAHQLGSSTLNCVSSAGRVVDLNGKNNGGRALETQRVCFE